VLCFGLVMTGTVSAQSDAYTYAFDVSQKEVSFDHLVSIENSGLINGVEYLIPFKGFTTHPFFDSNTGSKGEVFYNQQLYKEVTLLYDLFGDNLVLRYLNPNKTYSLIQLRKEKIDYFNLPAHRFRRYEGSASEKVINATEGFHEVLFDGNAISLLVKRKKLNKVVDGRVEYIPENLYYFLRDNQWTLVTGKSSVYNIDKQHKEEISSFVKNNRIRVSKKKDDDLVKLAAYIDNLIKKNP